MILICHPSIYHSGNGAPVPVAEIEVNPMDIDFKTVYIGQTESRHITIRNIGTEVLTVSEIAFAETSNLDISITSGFPVHQFLLGIVYKSRCCVHRKIPA